MNRPIKGLIFLALLLIMTMPVMQTKADDETTVLSLEPQNITIPYLDKDDGPTVVAINLAIQNVVGLRNVSLTMRYDSNILEPVFGKMDQDFYDKVGGYGGSGFGSGPSPNSHYFDIAPFSASAPGFSGSATLFVYYFKVVGTGSTQVNLVDTVIMESSGTNISHTVSGCTVEVVPLEVWVDGEYAELMAEHEALDLEFQTLTQELAALDANYTSLEGDCDQLNTTYQALDATYNDLVRDYDNLTQEFASLNANYSSLDTQYSLLQAELQALNMTHQELQADYEELQADYEEMVNTYEDLQNTYEDLQANHETLEADYNTAVTDYNNLEAEYEEKTSQLDATTNYMYIFAALTLALAATTVFFAVRKRKTA
ncbi:MAG: hypothetical protein NWF00_10405 [Candidatus Bathyarchaeota archaeon]|nr:hypothetical protein [Candidatus Bathyarchaeota archaeon]